MKAGSELPWTPDFELYPVPHAIVGARIHGQAVSVAWDDGRTSEHHAFLLRENSPDPETVHPLSRELLITPLEIPEDVTPVEASVDAAGALVVVWSGDGHVSRFHPGWLRAHAWFEDDAAQAAPSPRLWTSRELGEPPTFDGPATLNDDDAFLAWLEALRDFGLARLEGLPQQDGLLEELVTRVGTVRETNFGRVYHLAAKNDPDSNAYTSVELSQHMDIPTRECPPGLQFLYCRRNAVSGGQGVYVDGYRIAEDMRAEEPEHFDALTTIAWEYKNRAKDCDYRANGPVIRLDGSGNVTEIRFNPFLRAPLKAPLAVQERAYRSVRALIRWTRSPRYKLVFAYRPGDLLGFDNRRVLHGRTAYDNTGGDRFFEGMYSDRDDLYSRIRWLKNHRRACAQ